MSRTTEQWEALLEGTTEGPWGWRWDEGLLAIIGPDGQTVAIDADVRDSDALAVAPDAVAEVIRLRRELEGLKRTVGSLTLSAELLAGDHPIHRGVLNGAASEFRELQETIDRILNQGEP